MTRALTLAACLLWAGLGAAIDAEPAFEDPALQARYEALIREIRCLVCQNQTIADSNAPLAADLRREIRTMFAEGASERDVTDFLVARYGDFVLYRPPFKPTTWALWGAPFFLLIVGLAVFATVLRSRTRQPIDEDEAP